MIKDLTTSPRFHWMKDNIFGLPEGVFYLTCLATLAILLVNPDESLRWFIGSAVIGLIIIAKSGKNIKKNKRLLILPFAILLFGLIQVIWVEVFKQPGSAFTAAYRSYQNAGKVLIFSAIIVLAIRCQNNLTDKQRTIFGSVVIAISLGLYVWAGYQLYTFAGWNLNRFRVNLGFQHATGTAYALTLVSLLCSQAVLNLRIKSVAIIYVIHFLISLAVIITTQTRAAIILYPVLAVGLFLLNYCHNRRIMLYTLLAFMAALAVIAVALKPVLEQRYQNLKLDIVAYQNNDSATSVGARLAMQRAGLTAGAEHLAGQSLERRSETIVMHSGTDKSLAGAKTFLNVHLHNELIDTFSLKGIPGVVSLILLYLALLYTAFNNRSPLFIVISGAVIIYGLSDLMLYAKGEALSSMLALCIGLILVPTAKRECNHGQSD